MDAMTIYNAMATPPSNMVRTIQGGKLKGFSDIRPQWRYKVMTEQFGLAGIGWKYQIVRMWAEAGAAGEVCAFVHVYVFVRSGDEWSDAIEGVGGSKLVMQEKGQLVSNDEAYKMALTDALSVAMQKLGVAADVYAGEFADSKYRESRTEPITSASYKNTVSDIASPQTKQKVHELAAKDRERLAKEHVGKAVASATAVPRTSPQGERASEYPGGESTVEQRTQIRVLLHTMYSHESGGRGMVFSQEDIQMAYKYRQVASADEVIKFVADTLRERDPYNEALRVVE